ncbi:uncharacterized protein ATC70_008718 [Mucor velutinosus]|uniref:HMG box domain-containing protein n=1 Tax=Mucor velutinosus TaxID=708070 RepID=A0AAN7DM58_9FUNG|nr:hypothetical protein ATC70_008718 [Mucor velutinosus]
MSFEAEIQCPECQELIRDVDSLDAGECPWCGAFLVNVDLKSNSSKPTKEKAAPGLFDDITISDDESLIISKPSKAKRSSKAVENDLSLEDILSQFKQEQRGKTKPKARSKRKQVILSDSSDDEWIAPTPSKKKKKQEGSKKRKMENLYESDEDWDTMNHTLDVKKRYNSSFSSDSGSDYDQSDSEDESWLTKLKYTPKETKAIEEEEEEEEEESGLARKVAEVNKTKTKAKAETGPTRSTSSAVARQSAASSSLTSPTTASKSNRVHSFIYFNKEMRGKLAKENKDLSSKDLSRLVSGLWNKLSKQQKASYANRSLGPKRTSPPSGNGYVLYKKEQFPLVQKEYNLKGENAMGSASSIIGIRWKNLDPNIKETYTLRAKKMREDWAFEHPIEYEAYMDTMKARITETKMAKRKAKSR